MKDVYVYGVKVTANDHYYVESIANLLYSRVSEESVRKDVDQRLNEKLARIALKAVEEARKL